MLDHATAETPVAPDLPSPKMKVRRKRRRRRAESLHSINEAVVIDVRGIQQLAPPLSRSLFWSLWAAGRAPLGFKVGRKRLFHTAEIKAWLEGGCKPRSAAVAAEATAKLNRKLDQLNPRERQRAAGSTPRPSEDQQCNPILRPTADSRQ